MAADRVQTMTLQGLANRIVRGLLRVPLVSRGVGRRLITLYVVGRKSGKAYTVPVAYTRDHGELVIGTPVRVGQEFAYGRTAGRALPGAAPAG